MCLSDRSGEPVRRHGHDHARDNRIEHARALSAVASYRSLSSSISISDVDFIILRAPEIVVNSCVKGSWSRALLSLKSLLEPEHGLVICSKLSQDGSSSNLPKPSSQSRWFRSMKEDHRYHAARKRS